MSGDETKKDVSQVESGSASAASSNQNLNGTAGGKQPMQTDPGDLKQLVLDGLEKKADGKGIWLWLMFTLCLTPNILNGFHVSSYVFLGQMPANYYCVVPSLLDHGWTHDEVRNISTASGLTKNGTCSVLNWDYARLAEMNYGDALAYTASQPRPEEIPCLRVPGFAMHYEQPPGDSIVPEWDLICERTAFRSTVQVALSIGKFFGASIFGILSDKYGRKSSFSVAAVIYIVSGLLTTFSPFYLLLLLGRIGLGASASGVFYPPFALLTENAGPRHRSWMSIAFNFSYPIGTLVLALAAYYLHSWRDLSLALSIPSFLLIIHLYFLVESPRWLLSKGRERRAYQMVFGRKPPAELCDSNTDKELSPEEVAAATAKDVEAPKAPLGVRLRQSFGEFSKLYGTPVLCRRALICHFTWCVTSLCYYVTALNADNFAANRNVYVATTGTVDIIAYIISMVVLAHFGRKSTSFCFFMYAGVCLLVMLGIPKENTVVIVSLAMLGRLGITAVYAVLTLHTAELFPTEIRNTALGICSTMAHVGSMAAPYIVDLLGQLAWWIPSTICGTAILMAGVFTLLHPETKGVVLKDHAKQEGDVPGGDREPMKG